MRSPAAAMQTALAGDGVRLIFLIEIVLSQGTYRYAIAATDITFGGSTYTATAGFWSEVEESADIAAPRFRLTLQNLDGVLGALLDGLMATGADGRGRRLTVKTIEEGTIADSTAVLSDTFLISDYRLDRERVVLTLGTAGYLMALVPNRTIGSVRCPWVYKGAECGSVSTEKTCAKTLEDCKARFPAGAALRFGGQMGRAQSRRSFFV